MGSSKRSKRCCSLPKLPTKVLVNIFTRLPAKDIVECKYVCKLWHKLLSDSDFRKQHCAVSRNQLLLFRKTTKTDSRSFYGSKNSEHTLYSRVADQFDFNSKLGLCDINAIGSSISTVKLNNMFSGFTYPVMLIGCVNGLVCLRKRVPLPSEVPKEEREKRIYCRLWVGNPITGEYRSITNKLRDNDAFRFEFGYAEKSNEYKIIRIERRGHNAEASQGFVYTLGAKLWRKIGNVPYTRRDERHMAIPCHGALHWIVWRDYIVTFDIEKEDYRTFGLPSDLDRKKLFELGVIGNCLCVIQDNLERQINIWVMKDYGVEESWSKDYKIKSRFLNLDIVSLQEDGKIMAVADNNTLVKYDPKMEKFTTIEVPSKTLDFTFNAVLHKPSLLPPPQIKMSTECHWH
ncbi:hypothetical protein ACFE04_019384 [Oxalis oulophora]